MTRRHKYEALEDYLVRRQLSVHEITVSFKQIEKIIGDKLPNSAHTYSAWWANQTNTKNRPQAKAWLDANFVVEGYTKEQMDRLYNGMPQREYTTIKSLVTRPKAKIDMKEMGFDNGDDAEVPQIMQIELEDAEGNKYYIDQAERFNAFEFNKFKGWFCESGYRSIIIREPDGSIKRSYSCRDEPLGNIETGFKLFDKPTQCISPNCVSSADSKIPKQKNV